MLSNGRVLRLGVISNSMLSSSLYLTFFFVCLSLHSKPCQMYSRSPWRVSLWSIKQSANLFARTHPINNHLALSSSASPSLPNPITPPRGTQTTVNVAFTGRLPLELPTSTVKFPGSTT